MSTLSHTGTAFSPNAARPPLRLLERPRARPAAPRRVAKPRETFAQWCVRQVERFWAWGEGAQHHRLGSWQRR